MATRNIRRITLAIIAVVSFAGSAFGGDSLSAPPDRVVTKSRSISNMDSGLNSFVAGELGSDQLEALEYRIQDGFVQIVLEVDIQSMSSIVEEVEGFGGRKISMAKNFVQAEIPLNTLASVANTNGVQWVRQPYYAFHPDPAPHLAAKNLKAAQNSEGVSAMKADAWHNAGFDGSGVKIGVIDSGFGGYNGLLGSDLPPSNRVHYRGFGSVALKADEHHGTGCAEIVHDVAPGAELYLAHVSTGTDLLNAVDWLQQNGVDVVSMSLSWFFPGPGDGTGWAQDAISRDIQTNGTVWAVSAGNYRQEHWQRQSYDSDGDGWVEVYSTDDELNNLVDSYGNPLEFAADDEIWVRLVWNDWSSVTADYDLYFYRYDETDESWVQEGSSERSQSGGSGDRPWESLSLDVVTPGRYSFAISRTNVSGTHDLEVFASHRLQRQNAGGSISQPSDASNVLSVAASNYTSPYSDHSYSSMGPRNGPGGSFSGGPVKPDITGYAGVSTVSYGYQSFYGTSAACPHTAGAAALVVDGNPSFTGTQVRNYLLNNAADLGASGKDNTYGKGRLLLGPPPSTGGGGGGGGDAVTSCGNAFYDSGVTDSASWFNGGQAGNPDAMFAVRFKLSDFGYQPGAVEITAFCAGNSKNFGGLWPNEVFVYPDVNGKPNTNSVLARGTIRTGDGSGASVVTLSSPVTLNSNFWLVNRGYAAHAGEDFNMEHDGEANSGHSYISTSGANGLQLGTAGNYILRATLRAKSGGGGGGGGGGTFAYTYHVAAIAHASGVGGALWKSKLGILNRSGGAADVNLTYNYGSGSVTQWDRISNGELKTWDDAASSLFGVNKNNAGSVVIESTRPLVITARTYTENRDGSFGSFLPGVDEGLSYGQTGVLSQLTGNNDFRTNVAFVNLVDKSCDVEVRLYSAAGVPMGSAKTISVRDHSFRQISDVFKATGSLSRSNAYATVKVRTPGCEVWGYAAVIDGTSKYPGTDDATSIPISILP